MPTRWNSTCKMFESVLKQTSTLQPFHNRMASCGQVQLFPEEGWACIENLFDFLAVLNNVTKILLGFIISRV
ncbi:hypothetical protein HanIR_Chr10g0496741 [Helianthus annuus]|nr:hypothetical protein HanIR_Chr10g0496741 [Helianthus annuus]